MLKCRSCEAEIKDYFLSLGNSPLSNSYLTEKQLNESEIYLPLDVYFCPNCYLVQIGEYEKIENIFSSDYAYYSSYSKSWLEHCKSYVEMITNRLALNENSFVVEIASNDGYLLQYFNEKNIPCLGVEPTEGTAKVAIAKGVKTDISFFNTTYAKKMARKPDLILGNNVLAHNPALNDFVAGLKIALKENGVINLEFPHLLQLMKYNQFDTIYQEHYSYLSLHAINNLFNKHTLEVFDVEKLSTHGGSIRVYAKHIEDNSKSINESVEKMLKEEMEFGLTNPEFYLSFKNKVEKIKRGLLSILIELKNKNKKIIGYGAPAKGNTLLNYCGIRSDFLDYTVDLNPQKQNKFLPGTHISIKSPDVIKEDKPDYIVILPWNIKDEIINQLAYTKEWDCKFIVPIPEPQIL